MQMLRTFIFNMLQFLLILSIWMKFKLYFIKENVYKYLILYTATLPSTYRTDLSYYPILLINSRVMNLYGHFHLLSAVNIVSVKYLSVHSCPLLCDLFVTIELWVVLGGKYHKSKGVETEHTRSTKGYGDSLVVEKRPNCYMEWIEETLLERSKYTLYFGRWFILFSYVSAYLCPAVLSVGTKCGCRICGWFFVI